MDAAGIDHTHDVVLCIEMAGNRISIASRGFETGVQGLLGLPIHPLIQTSKPTGAIAKRCRRHRARTHTQRHIDFGFRDINA